MKRYCKHRLAVLLLYALAAVFFPLIQYLYGLPMAPVGYALVIIGFLLLVAAAMDFPRFARQTRALQAALDNLSEAAHALPPPLHPLEAMYREMALSLYELLQTQAETLTRRHGDQVEYYTMWVHQY